MMRFSSALDRRDARGATVRAARAAVREEAKARLAILMPGESAIFILPPDQPARRDCANIINLAAYRLFGISRYRVRTTDAGYVVTRLESVL